MTLIETESLLVASQTDVGRKRSGNEDSHALWSSEDPQERARRGILMVVADGMGGANAGEVASSLAVEHVIGSYRQATTPDPAEALRESIETANQVVNTQASENGEQRGMGTTCTAIVVRDRKVWVGHVGDSRAYLIRGRHLRRLTRDHSLVSELVERGQLTEEQAKTDPRRNVVTRSVGATPTVQVDAVLIDDTLRPGDTLLVCSDGMHGLVSEHEMIETTSEMPPPAACQALIDIANQNGGPDNITVIIARVPGVPEPEPLKLGAKKAGRQGGPVPILIVLLVSLVGAGAAVVWLLMPHGSGSSGSAGAIAAPPSTTSAEPPAELPPAAAATKPAPPQANPGPVTTKVASTAAASPKVSAPPRVVSPAPAPDGGTAAAAGGDRSVRFVSRPFQSCTFVLDSSFPIDGVGSMPADLTAGIHKLQVTNAQGQTVELSIDTGEISSGDYLVKFPGSDDTGEIQVDLEGARSGYLLVDGNQYPTQVPGVVQGIATGRHRIGMARAGGNTFEGPDHIDVRAGGRVQVTFRRQAP